VCAWKPWRAHTQNYSNDGSNHDDCTKLNHRETKNPLVCRLGFYFLRDPQEMFFPSTDSKMSLKISCDVPGWTVIGS
jgi:hypothetical protein